MQVRRKRQRADRRWFEFLEQRQLLAADLILSDGMTVCEAADVASTENPTVDEQLPIAPATVDPTVMDAAHANVVRNAEPAAAADRAIALNAEGDRSLVVYAPRTFLPGKPVLVRAQLAFADGTVDQTAWDSTVALEISDPSMDLPDDKNSIALLNGMGSVLLPIDATEPFELMATIGDDIVTIPMEPLINPNVTQVSGTLTGDQTVWSGVIEVTDDVIIPDGHTLTIEEGTIVTVNGVVQQAAEQIAPLIRVQGTLRALGTATSPITITASDPDQPWGELHVSGGEAELRHVSLTRAGNSDRGGHTNTGPAIRMTSNGTVSLNNSNVTDISGKILFSTSGDLHVENSLLSRAVMGPEIQSTQLEFRHSWIVDMAGRFHHNRTVDDNDGIYLHDQRAGQTIELIDSVVAGVQDDGIDTLGSDILVLRSIVRDVTDKAISVFNGETTVVRSLLVNSDIGIETKGSGRSNATTNIQNSTIANVRRAIRARDNNAPNATIIYNIVNSILHVRSGGDAIYTDYDPENMRINYTWANEAWTSAGSGDGNIVGAPELVNPSANDYRLPAGSPAIDAADPTTDPDADGTRADLGYLASEAVAGGATGDFDQDGDLDTDDLDLICQFVRNGQYASRMDLDGDGVVTADDMVDALVRADGFDTFRGDANLDFRFDTRDLVQVFQTGWYEDGVPGNANWATGDWNCDGDFTSADLVGAFQDGGYVG